MTTKNKNMKWVVFVFITVSLFILGSIVVKRNIIDVIYLCLLMVYLTHYIHINQKL